MVTPVLRLVKPIVCHKATDLPPGTTPRTDGLFSVRSVHTWKQEERIVLNPENCDLTKFTANLNGLFPEDAHCPTGLAMFEVRRTSISTNFGEGKRLQFPGKLLVKQVI